MIDLKNEVNKLFLNDNTINFFFFKLATKKLFFKSDYKMSDKKN